MEARIGIIGGSGLGQVLLQQANGRPQSVTTPFGPPSAEPILATWEGVPVAYLARHGAGHTIPPSQINYRANIWALKSLGCQWILASGAVGSLRETIAPRDLVIVDQVIDKTHRRVGTFFDQAAVHVEFAEPFCPTLRRILSEVAEGLSPQAYRIHRQGTYVCMEGPAFSTRAESLMHQAWGGDLIGMTAMPEAKLAREAEISYGLIALATDYDCWRPHPPGQNPQELLKVIIGHLHQATAHAMELLRATLPELWRQKESYFPSHHALELGIWTDRQAIDSETRQRLELLWGKYLS